MDPIGDDLNLQTVKQVTAFNQPQYAPSPFPGDGGHGGVKMRNLAIAVFHRVYNILKSGIAVPHGNLNPLSRKLIPKFQRAGKFGCSRPPYDIALAPPEDAPDTLGAGRRPGPGKSKVLPDGCLKGGASALLLPRPA